MTHDNPDVIGRIGEGDLLWIDPLGVERPYTARVRDVSDGGIEIRTERCDRHGGVSRVSRRLSAEELVRLDVNGALVIDPERPAGTL